MSGTSSPLSPPSVPLLADLQSLTNPGAMYLFRYFEFGSKKRRKRKERNEFLFHPAFEKKKEERRKRQNER
jgi:hypothetical protein